MMPDSANFVLIKGDYCLEWNQKNDIDEIKQNPEEIQRQISASLELKRLKKQEEVDQLVAYLATFSS